MTCPWTISMVREICSDSSWYSVSGMYSGSSSNHHGLLMGIIFARSFGMEAASA
jgi:hypothetical protein